MSGQVQKDRRAHETVFEVYQRKEKGRSRVMYVDIAFISSCMLVNYPLCAQVSDHLKPIPSPVRGPRGTAPKGKAIGIDKRRKRVHDDNGSGGVGSELGDSDSDGSSIMTSKIAELQSELKMTEEQARAAATILLGR